MRYQPKFSRIQEILENLSVKRVSMEELQEKFRTSKRTIHRDFEYIRDNLGIDIKYDRAEQRYCINSIVEGISIGKLFLHKKNFMHSMHKEG